MASPQVLDVADHPHDFHPSVPEFRAALRDAFADCLLIGKESGAHKPSLTIATGAEPSESRSVKSAALDERDTGAPEKRLDPPCRL